jgi:hypothetical protein
VRIREAYVGEGGGQGIDTDKAKRWTVQRLWYEATDPVASRDSLAACRSRGVGVGLKMNGAGEATAAAMHTSLADHGFGPGTQPTSCGAMFDAEMHDAAAIVALLRRWRELRPTRLTVWTLEPFQGGLGGWITAELVQLVNADQNLTVVVQEYIDDHHGDQLYPAAGAECRDELERLGIRRERLSSFIAVKANTPIPYGWAGILFGFAALPASPPIPL